MQVKADSATMQWNLLNMNTYAKSIQTWHIPDRLNLSNNKEPKILQSLIFIKFPQLKILNLEYNLLASIQVLQNIQLPCLQQLSINDNYVFCCRSFRRCMFQNLKKLGISGNRIGEITGLVQLFSPYLRQLSVERDAGRRVQGYDARWFMKLEPLGIFQMLNFKSQKRIKQNALKEQIFKKYPYITL